MELTYAGRDEYLNRDSVTDGNRIFFKRMVNTRRLEYQKVRFDGLTIGCDLEAEYASRGKVLHANDALGNSFGTTDSPLGYDGALNVVEVRPGVFPANEPERLFDAIHSLWKTAKVNGNFTYTGNKYPIGLHLHLGHSRGLPVGRSLVKALNRYVGNLCYKGNGGARIRYNYSSISNNIGTNGSGSAIETKNYGFEYRVPPAWIAADKRAFCVVYKIFVAVYLGWIQGKIGEVDYKTMGKPGEYKKLGIKWDDVNYVIRHCLRNRENSRDVKCYS